MQIFDQMWDQLL